MITERESRPGETGRLKSLAATPSTFDQGSARLGQRASGSFASTLVGALTAYAALSEDLRPAPGTCVVVERGRESDVRGTVLGYDRRGVAVEARFAIVGLQTVYIPWVAVKGLIEVDS